MFVVSGNCEEYIDGKWTPMKPGDLHYNPRGVIHGSRLVGTEPLRAITFFAAAPPADGDKIFVNEGKTSAKPGDVVGNPRLLDTQFKKGGIINIDEWIAKHPIEPGATMRSDFAIGTPRFQLNIGQVPKLGVHYHGYGRRRGDLRP